MGCKPNTGTSGNAKLAGNETKLKLRTRGRMTPAAPQDYVSTGDFVGSGETPEDRIADVYGINPNPGSDWPIPSE
jgi:hypothetical protein